MNRPYNEINPTYILTYISQSTLKAKTKQSQRTLYDFLPFLDIQIKLGPTVYTYQWCTEGGRGNAGNTPPQAFKRYNNIFPQYNA